MRNCARRWSIRRQHRKCSASSAARRRTCSRCLDAIVESAARVCGIDDLVLHLQEGNSLISRAHFGSIPVPTSRAEISMDDLQFRWMREHGTLHIPDVTEQNEFQVVNISGWRTFLPFLYAKRRNSLED